jgi:hypothetical protein
MWRFADNAAIGGLRASADKPLREANGICVYLRNRPLVAAQDERLLFYDHYSVYEWM